MTDARPADRLLRHSHITCDQCNLGNICIPKGLDAADIDKLSDLVKRNSMLHKGETLYHTGSEFKGIIALRSGSAKLINHDAAGNTLIIDFCLPGELLGFDGLSTQQHQCTAIALETLSFCVLPAHKITAIANSYPNLSQILLQRSGEQFEQHIQHRILHRRSAEAKVACFIIRLSERLKARGYAELEFRLSMSREDIGNHLGIAHETV